MVSSEARREHEIPGVGVTDVCESPWVLRIKPQFPEPVLTPNSVGKRTSVVGFQFFEDLDISQSKPLLLFVTQPESHFPCYFA